MISNPYSPPAEHESVARSKQPSKRFGRILIAIVLLYPVIAVGLIYFGWAIRALQLGRLPVPYRDSSDSMFVGTVCSVAAVMLIVSPIALLFGFVLSVQCPFGRFDTDLHSPAIAIRMLSLLTYLGLVAAMILLLIYDPGRVLDWFLD